MPIIGLLLLAFKAWMLIDAMQRCGAGCGQFNYWFLICWVPFGDWVYFFVVKIHDPSFARFKKILFSKKQSIENLRYNLRTSPSYLNKITLAKALHDRSQFQEALDLVNEILVNESEDKEALMVKGFCQKSLGDLKGSSETFAMIVKREFSFKDFTAVIALIDLKWELGNKEESIEMLKGVIAKSHILAHTTQLAKYLVSMSQFSEAKNLLQKALEDYKHSPRYVQKQARREAREARKLLLSL